MATEDDNRFLDRLNSGDTIFCAEGYLLELERRGYLQAGPLVPEVVLDNPDVLKQLHREYLRAGTDVIEAFTYYANRDKLKTIGREGDLEKMNIQALRIAKEVADEGNLLFAGNICNTWAYDPDNKEESSKIVRDMYVEQVRWAKEAGVDYIIAETISHLGEALIALDVVAEFELPCVVTLAIISGETKTSDGYDIVEACKTLCSKGADVVGLNCEVGPDAMIPLLTQLVDELDCPVAALPAPYHTTVEDSMRNIPDYPIDLDLHLCSRREMADFAAQAQKIGVQYIGVCCGAGPHHIRAMAEALGRKPPASKYSPEPAKQGTLRSQQSKKQDPA